MSGASLRATIEGFESELAQRRHDRDLISAEVREQQDKLGQVSEQLAKLAERLNR